MKNLDIKKEKNYRIFIPKLQPVAYRVINSDRAIIIKNDVFGIVNEKGETIVPFNYQYIEFTDNGYYFAIDKDNEYDVTIFDYNGNVIFQTCEHMIDTCTFQNVYKEGLIKIYEYDDDNHKLFGFIDINGNQVIPCIYREANGFSEGLAKVANEQGLCGYIDKTGKEVIPCIYKQAYNFENGVAIVRKSWYEVGVIDKFGNEIIPCSYKSIDFMKQHPLLKCATSFDNSSNIDVRTITGEIVDSLSGIYKDISYGDNPEFMRGSKNSKMFTGCYINKEGQKFNFEDYDIADVSYNGLAKVSKDRKTFDFINENGEVVISGLDKYSIVRSFKAKNYAFVKDKETNKWGAIDREGKEVIPCYYDSIKEIDENTLIAKYENKCGIIDSMNNIVIPFIYKDIMGERLLGKYIVRDFTDTRFLVDENNQKYLYTSLGIRLVDDVNDHDNPYISFVLQSFSELKNFSPILIEKIEEVYTLKIMGETIHFKTEEEREAFLEDFAKVEEELVKSKVLNKTM